MASEHQELIQVLNTAIVKSKEHRIDSSYEKRLLKACERPAFKVLTVAINHLSESEKLSRDQAALQIVDTVKELDLIWDDYIRIEGMGRLKELLSNSPRH